MVKNSSSRQTQSTLSRAPVSNTKKQRPVWLFILIGVALLSVISVGAILLTKPGEKAPMSKEEECKKNFGGYNHTTGECIYSVDRPLIYLYPTTGTKVNVKLGKPGQLTTTYPKYDASTGWNVIARPSGNLTDTQTGRSLYGLYWEGQGRSKPAASTEMNEGFIVAGEDTAEFLEDKLAQLGLTDREANEFIIYWLPQMEHSEHNFIRFETMDEINEAMPLNITPLPDTTIRVMMDWQSLSAKETDSLRQTMTEQQLPTAPARTGFTVVEWGGSKLSDNKSR